MRESIALDINRDAPTETMVRCLMNQAGMFAETVAQQFVAALLEVRFGANRVVLETRSMKSSGHYRIEYVWLVVNPIAYLTTFTPSRESALVADELLKRELRPYLLTLEDEVATARQVLRDSGINTRISVMPISSWAGIAIDMHATATTMNTLAILCDVLDIYNVNVESLHPSKVLPVEVPAFLREAQENPAQTAPGS